MGSPTPINWARDFAAGLVSIRQLVDAGLVEVADAASLEDVKEAFDIRVPNSLLEGVLSGDPTLARQFVPSPEELAILPAELEDPIGDEAWSPVDGVTHRYPDRALLKLTYQCASYCRFCFRRYKVSEPDNNLDPAALDRALDYIARSSGIREVILTGGDPLTLTDARLAVACEALARMPHVRLLRIHTRIPTVLPSRITPALLATLRSSGKAVWLVAHINALAELTGEARSALGRLVDGGIPVLAQSVLLRGVNATTEALASLFEELASLRVTPYYLHYPDLARGTGHFRVPLTEALDIVRGLRGRTSGFAIPRLVVDIPGGRGKVVVEPEGARHLGGGTWCFRSPLDGGETIVNYPE
jgi:lysine 2,3-aminomutase